MVSTIEAIYYAAWEVLEENRARAQGSQQRQNCETLLQRQQEDLMHLFWIFGIQRSLAGTTAVQTGKPLPYSVEGKEERRAQRRCIGTEKHQRDLEKGRLLKEQARVAMEASEKFTRDETTRQ